jgi:transcriptional accessory protein Tex/SPT6
VKVGQIVKVRVVEVNVPLKRISLTMKGENVKASGNVPSKPNNQVRPAAPEPSDMNSQLEQLKQRFAK